MTNLLKKTNPIFLSMLAGLLSFTLMLAPASGSFWGLLLFLFTSYPLFLIARLCGKQSGIIAVATTFFLAFIFANAFLFLALIGAPALLILWEARDKKIIPINRVLVLLASYFILLIISFYYGSMLASIDLKQNLTNLAAFIYDRLEENSDEASLSLIAGTKDVFIFLATRLVLGFTAIYMMLILFGNWLLASFSLKKIAPHQYKPFEPIAKIRMPLWFFIAFLILTASNFFFPQFFLGLAIYPLLAFNILLVGLGVIHALINHFISRWQPIIFILVYMSLIFFPLIGITITLLGALDQLINLRKFIQSKQSEEI